MIAPLTQKIRLNAAISPASDRVNSNRPTSQALVMLN